MKILMRKKMGFFVGPGNGDRSGDAYFEAAHRGRNRWDADVGCGEDGDGPPVIHKGSCHCAAIQFTLRDKQCVVAFDSPGKIRYPYVVTGDADFQLTSGSQFLGVYYVTLPPPAEEDCVGDDLVTAAHTFCKRCGVPILRAPDSTGNCLEVNANCLDLPVGEGETSVFFKETDERGLAAGMPISSQWDKNNHNPHFPMTEPLIPPAARANRAFTSRRSRRTKKSLAQHSLTIPSPRSSSHRITSTASLGGRMPPQDSPTPTTLSTSSTTAQSVSYYSCHTSPAAAVRRSNGIGGGASSTTSPLYDQETSSIETSPSSPPPSPPLDTVPAMGISNWAVGPSLRSPSVPSVETLGKKKKSAVDEPLVRDQLKYYMKKHLTTTDEINETAGRALSL